MATVRNLAVEITANASKLRSELNSAQRNINSFSSNVTRRIGGAAKVIAGLGVAAGTAFVAFGAAGVYQINRVAAEIDELAKSASNLRFDVGDLQKLRFIAGQTGTSVSEMERAIQMMNRQLTNGSDKTAEALRGIGFSIDQVMAMRPAERFKAIAQALSGIDDEGQQTAAMLELFGRSGSNMLNLLNADFDKLGETFDEMGVRLTNQQAAAVEAYQDAKDRLGTMWQGFKMQFTANMAEPLRTVTERIEKMAKELGGMDVLANRAAIGVLEFVRGGVIGLQNLINKVGSLELFWMRVQLAVLATGEAIAKVGNMLTPSVWAQKLGVNFNDTDLQQVERNLSGAAGMVADQMGVRQAELSGRSGILDPAVSALTEMIEELKKAGTATKELEESADGAARSLDKWDKLVDDMFNSSNNQVSVKLDLTTDRGHLVGEVVASPEMARKMQEIAKRTVNDTARQVLA